MKNSDFNTIKKTITEYMEKKLPDAFVGLELDIKDYYNNGTYTIYPTYIIKDNTEMAELVKTGHSFVLKAEPYAEAYQKKMTSDMEKLFGITIRFSGRGFTMESYLIRLKNR